LERGQTACESPEGPNTKTRPDVKGIEDADTTAEFRDAPHRNGGTQDERFVNGEIRTNFSCNSADGKGRTEGRIGQDRKIDSHAIQFASAKDGAGAGHTGKCTNGTTGTEKPKIEHAHGRSETPDAP
jgi:hypothetical protein